MDWESFSKIVYRSRKFAKSFIGEKQLTLSILRRDNFITTYFIICLTHLYVFALGLNKNKQDPQNWNGGYKIKLLDITFF